MKPLYLDLCLFFGGALGAVARGYLADEPTWTKRRIAEALLTGAALMVLVGFGLIPAEWKQDALMSRPTLTIAASGLVSALAGGAILYYLKAAMMKFLPAPPGEK